MTSTARHCSAGWRQVEHYGFLSLKIVEGATETTNLIFLTIVFMHCLWVIIHFWKMRFDKHFVKNYRLEGRHRVAVDDE